MKKRIATLFPALAHRNYQLWFLGQFTSLIGTWIQMVAQGWLVLELTNSAFWVGAIAAVSTVPILLFSLFGGVIVDRYSKRRILFIAETIAMILAFAMGILTVTGTITILQIAIIGLIMGIVTAIDMPARLSFAAELVERPSLPSALALNAGMFNAARVVGPAIAGILIGTIGLGGAFLVNGLSFLAVLTALLFIKTSHVAPLHHDHPLESIKQGIVYSYAHRIIFTLLIFCGVTSIFGWSYAVILPVVVKNTFHLGAAGLGYFNAAAGLGAVAATILVSAYAKKISSTAFIVGGAWIFSFALILFSFTNNFYVAIVLLFLTGLGLLMQFATINATIQHHVEDKYRGRVMSIYTLMFMGLSPFGAFQVGYLSEHFGTQIAIRVGAVIVLLFSTLIYFNRSRLRQIEA